VDAHVFWAIAAGDVHTCAIDPYGVTWCWGSNPHGQLGDPSVTESAVPIVAGGGAIRFASITAGSNFTCGLSASGRASCWGENSGGQLGDGSNFDRPLPVAVASGAFTSIAAGSNHACGVTAEGDAYCWGRNTFGQLGDGGNFDRNTPVRVRGGARFTSITAGANHTCAVAVDGNAYCWGQNTYGQLGTGVAGDMAQPATVADGHLFASVHAFASHTCGLTVRGEAFCWGNNSENQLGDGTQTPRALDVNRKIAIAETKPVLATQRLDAVHERPGLIAPAPAGGGVVEVGQCVGQRVDVGADAEAKMLEIVTGVGDNRQCAIR
jgi:alpha-tubulin suppressor-like RCC1 family protein